MHLEERIKNGMPFYEHGHTDPIDIEQEKKLEAQRRHRQRSNVLTITTPVRARM